MIKENILRRILYTGAGLVIIVAIFFPLDSILYIILDKSGEATPASGIFGTLFVVVLHLLILYAFREAIIVNKRKGYLGNVVYIVSGVGLLLLGLLILNIAKEFWGNENYPLTAITFFFCSGCDFFAALIAFIAPFLQHRSAHEK